MHHLLILPVVHNHSIACAHAGMADRRTTHVAAYGYHCFLFPDIQNRRRGSSATSSSVLFAQHPHRHLDGCGTLPGAPSLTWPSALSCAVCSAMARSARKRSRRSTRPAAVSPGGASTSDATWWRILHAICRVCESAARPPIAKGATLNSKQGYPSEWASQTMQAGQSVPCCI